ncbi:hypothetical protein D0865_05931 [Hortaea werneckii]|uniref:ATP-dependent DNA helicase n=1 Tax=Hortaea werneckii TaxID=91943 RepID=A0A3M7CJL1_HORWE|nr:hypothetical protein D0865_05931 [Hortaea werneckii]
MSSCKREGSVNAPKRQSQRSLESLGVHGGSRNTNTSHPGSHLDRKRRQEGLRTTLYASSTGFEDDVPKHVPKDYGSVQPSNEPVESSLNELMNNARPKKRPKLQAQRDRSSNSGDHTQRDDRASATQAPPPRTAPTAVIDLTLQDDEPPPDDEPPQEAIPRAFRHPASDGSVQKAPGSLKGHTAQPAAGFQGFATMPPVSNPVIHQVPSGTQPAPSTSRYVGFSPGIVTPAMPAASPPVPTGMPIAAYHWSYPGYPPVSHLPSPSQTLNRFPGHATGQAYSPPHGSPPRTQKPHARKVQKRASAERPLKQDFKNDQRSSSSDARATTCSCGQPVIDIQSTVKCAGVMCKRGTFHRACVGLGTRPVTDGWRCWECRRNSTAASGPPRSSQQPSDMRIVPPSFSVDRGDLMPEPPLHPEQAEVVNTIADGFNVFYTGSAGTGKSTVLKAFVRKLKDQGRKVDIVAPSGIAALNVGGMTIFAYAGWRPDSLKEPLQKLKQQAHGRSVRKRLCATDVLVIDEISMVERDLLVRLDTIMREIRPGWQPTDERGKFVAQTSPHRRDMPFGGAQIVVTGDFCQLPPVKPFRTCIDCGGDDLPGYHMQDARDMMCKRCQRVYKDSEKWAFSSEAWADCDFRYFELKQIHRQSDKRFIDILNKCRYGQSLSPDQRQLLLTPKPDPVGAVKLLPRKAEVESENRRNFASLPAQARRFECHDCFIWRNEEQTPELQKHRSPRYADRPNGPLLSLKDHRLEEAIELKQGMLVILLVNLDFKLGLVNGSQGKIIGWEEHSDAKVFPPREERRMPSSPRKARPSGKFDSPSKFRSRRGGPSSPTRFGGGESTSLKPEHVIIKESQTRAFIGRNAPTTAFWPVVAFHNGVTQAIYPHCELSELGAEEPYSVLGRTQMPLLAAWAITVHKSQGMTLDRVIVDLWNSFEREMVYVALSRARGLDGLKVVRLARVMERGVNEEVRGFLSEHGMGDYR